MWGGELAKIRVDDLNKSVMEILEAYKGATEEDVKRAVDKVGKECVDELKNAHPPGSKNWDRYNSGWTIMQTKKDKKEHIWMILFSVLIILIKDILKRTRYIKLNVIVGNQK